MNISSSLCQFLSKTFILYGIFKIDAKNQKSECWRKQMAHLLHYNNCNYFLQATGCLSQRRHGSRRSGGGLVVVLLIPATTFLTDKRLVQIPSLHDFIEQLSVCVCGMVTSNQTPTAGHPLQSGGLGTVLERRDGFTSQR